MKNKMKNLSKDQIQRIIFISLLVLVFAAFFITLSLTTGSEKKPDDKDPIENPDDKDPVDDPKDEDPVPVVEKIGLPLQGSFEVVRKYYDANGTVEEQELAVIQFGKRYYISNGVALVSSTGANFNVIASLSGEVVSVENSPIYGVTVTLKHPNGIYTEYSSLTSAGVAVGDEIAKGTVLGVSGVCEYDSSLASHVYFKIIVDNVNYNPEKCFGKEVTNLS